MPRHLWTAIRMTIVTAVLVGVAYPLVVTVAARLTMPQRADGSMVERDGRVVGSRLIAQRFSSPEYFQPRPSAAGDGYNAMASAASNLGPTSETLQTRVAADVLAVVATNPGLRSGAVPVDMVTASGSGLDPDISIANARAQAPRVAAARGLSLSTVLALVDRHTTGRQFGFLGEPRVNVLELNLALDDMTGATP